MAGFLEYYISRSLEEILDSETISESSESFSVSSFIRKNKSGSAMDAHIARLSRKHPSIQR